MQKTSKPKNGAKPLYTENGKDYYGIWDLVCAQDNQPWWEVIGMTKEQLKKDKEKTLSVYPQ